MKAKKLLSIYNWIVLMTAIIYAIKTYFVDWIENQTYLKRFGNLNNLPVKCYPLPPIFIDLIFFSVIAVAFYLTKKLKKRISTKSKLNGEDYFLIFLLTLFIIFPFLFFDSNLIEIIFNSTRDYFLANPVR